MHCVSDEKENRPFNAVEEEVRKISSKEEELRRKARDLENEMMQIREAKVDVILRQFEQQLVKEAELEERRHTEKLRSDYEAKAGQVEAERQAQEIEVDNQLK
jgi:hypothetical protein